MSSPDPAAAATPSDSGPAPNPMLGAVIDALSGTSAIDPLTLMRTQLDSYAQDNPQIAQLLQALEQRRKRPPPVEDEPVTDMDESSRDPESRLDEPADAEATLEDVGDRLYAELESLRRRSARLAAALGACRLCFGEDASCEVCGGLGVAGSRSPRPEAFRRYVLPAIRRAREVESGGGGRAPPRARDLDRPMTPRRQFEHQLDQSTMERQVTP